MTSDSKWTLTTKQLYRGAMGVAALALAVAALMPWMLPKTMTIATQSYVEAQAGAVENQVAELRAHDQEQDKQLQLIHVSIKGFGDGQNKSRAAQEAARVTQHLRNADRRVAEYERIRAACMRNLEAEPQREPLDGVAY